jgi:3-dehydroquinate synthase
MQTLRVDLGERSYPIYIGAGLLDDGACLRGHLAGRQVLVVSNDKVAPLYLERLRAALGDGLRCDEVLLPDGEEYKSLAVLERIFDMALRCGHDRGTTIVALGGGVVGDMAGFAAACYQRGVAFVQVPTTLLAQVDSSVGGKTAVNHPLGKNMIGAFYQPRAVLIDTDVLATLPAREYAAGLAEVLKYGLICDAGFYDWLRERREALMARDRDTLARAIERSCAAKARVVSDDEREAGRRAILNLGHTFGHAIEAAEGYGAWLHGEAVAAGMVMAAELSCQRGWLAPADVAGVVDWLQGVGLPVAPPPLAAATWLAHMGRDKKVIDGRLRLVLLKAVGHALVVDDVSQEELTRFLAPYTGPDTDP